MDRILSGPNIHLRGTAYRLQARGLLEASGDPLKIRAALETSLKYLRRAGDPLETAKTLALLAELELESGHDQQAKELGPVRLASLGLVWQHLFTAKTEAAGRWSTSPDAEAPDRHLSGRPFFGNVGRVRPQHRS